ncbi:89c99283-3616-4521-9a3f-6b01f2e65019 [Thermothielavioides terrestris]|uniref:89c99283-3616-4521-9a3f-6b01f2e65019 n=1 Tax=Thermothielavioides terrestris TaxID=2587410 RepID=A0A3S4C965_9PEZI|nr:89c99283-3616-4521-9a3f-6b01f2e65019 [Thermothielavioides terrestris]
MERSTAGTDPNDDTGSEGIVMRHLDPDTGRPIELFLPAAPEHDANGLPGGHGDNGSIVEWQPDDPKNPHNWPRSRKNLHFFLVTAMTALVRFNIGMIAPSQMRIMSDFGADNRHVITGFVVSGFVLGQTAGPVFMEPLSEILGRRAVYIVGTTGFSLCTVGCWLAWSLTSLIVFRCLAGTFGSCALAVGPRILNDLTRAEPSIIYSFCGILGFAIGPVVGGHLADALDWHMVCLISGVAATVMALAVTFLVQETYGPLLLQWEAERRRRESGNPHIRSALDRGLTPGARFRRSIVRPFAAMILTLRSFIYMAVGALAYGFLLVVLTTIGYVFAALLSEPPDRIALIYRRCAHALNRVGEQGS